MFRIRPSISRVLPQTRPEIRSRPQVRLASSSRPKKGREIWTNERLQVDGKYPLATAVRDAIHPSLEVRKKARKGILSSTQSVHGVHLRTQIVSPDLCGTSISAHEKRRGGKLILEAVR